MSYKQNNTDNPNVKLSRFASFRLPKFVKKLSSAGEDDVKTASEGKDASEISKEKDCENKPFYSDGLFGHPIPKDLKDLPSHAHCFKYFLGGIPTIVYKLIRYLTLKGMKTEGLFRVSGSLIEIQTIKGQFNSGFDVDLFDVSTCSSVHVAAALLKLYFRELPDSLIPYELYELIEQTIYSPESKPSSASSQHGQVSGEQNKNLELLRDIIRQIPPVYYDTLRLLMKFLNRVANLSAINKMSSANLAICFAPNLLKRSAQRSHNFSQSGSATVSSTQSNNSSHTPSEKESINSTSSVAQKTTTSNGKGGSGRNEKRNANEGSTSLPTANENLVISIFDSPHATQLIKTLIDESEFMFLMAQDETSDHPTSDSKSIHLLDEKDTDKRYQSFQLLTLDEILNSDLFEEESQFLSLEQALKSDLLESEPDIDDFSN